MAPLAVDPAALDGAGAAVVAAGEGLGSVIAALTSGLAGCAGMAGDDAAGVVFGRAYDRSAAALFEAMVVTRNGLSNLGDGVRMSAHNYSLAEAMSDVGGRAAALPVPPSTGCVAPGWAPSAVGTGGAVPAGWGWVAPYIGMIWPTGDSGKLRAAAAGWRAAGAKFALAEIAGTAGPMGVIRAQQLPEAGLIEAAFSDAYAATTAVVGQCETIAAQLEGYAARIDAVHRAVLDLLARICDPLTGIKEVWEFLTDQDEDEIARIAHDIAAVIEQFRGEADALGAEIAGVVSQAQTTITTMGRHAAKQWDQFLHANPVGRAVNRHGQQLKGFGEEAFAMAKDSWDLGPLRAPIDPIGWYRAWQEMLTGMAPLVGLGGGDAPAVLESWKQFGKNVIHWDDWKTNPDEAFGKTVFDVATLALPGGPLSKLGSKSRGIVEAMEGLKRPLDPPAPRVEPHTAPPPPRTPRVEPPESGRPAPAPQPNSRLPHSPTESKTPPTDAPAAGEPAKPTGPAPAPAGPRPSAPAAPSEHLPTSHPQPGEAIARAPAPASPGGSPVEPTPAGTHPREPALAATATHPSPPHSIPPANHPPEPPPLGGTPHSGAPGTHPNEPPSSHDGAPHGQGESGDPHETHPSDGDSSPSDDGHGTGVHHEPPKAREVFPDAKPYGELTEHEYRAQFEDDNGKLRYPDQDDPAKPYAIPGTAHSMTEAEIWSLDGRKLDRIGYPGGEWLAPAGTPYEGRSLPHTSLEKPYFAYTVNVNAGLPAGWKLEESLAAPWFGHPGGEPQYKIIAPRDDWPRVQDLIDRGFLTSD
ncbi:TNT domain-containing protein [Mycobacterium lacus]|uniref:Uncharacterized protein n=3 Tax=Mycobacterium lacus TaxID=169765 RepID=A0A1X1XK68_9MYCO|nr:ADP-ribosyltransferse [Mycobacterium lacus]BBX99003.1 hypothetical protein MLAC_42970 [Mycobacterium lacus]